MTERTFSIRTEPIPFRVGDTRLFLVPEADGADFVEAYEELRTAQARLTGRKATSSKPGKAEDVSAQSLRQVSTALRAFVDRFLTEDSKAVFADLKVPDRILVEITEYLAEVFGGGSGNRDEAGGTSTG